MLMIRVGAWTCTIKQISVTQSYSTAQCNLKVSFLKAFSVGTRTVKIQHLYMAGGA